MWLEALSKPPLEPKPSIGLQIQILEIVPPLAGFKSATRLNSTTQLCFFRAIIIVRIISIQVVIKTAPANPHDRTQHGYGIGLHLLPDKIKSYFDSLAKKAAAFFKISRSIKRRLFSF
ncbi:MAG: hypothetical protein PVI89_12900, partial [Desulfobacteraceae bacterium]